MKKKFLFLAVLLISSASFACPACEGLYDEDKYHKTENNNASSNFNSESYMKSNDFKEAKFEITYDTPIWQKEVGKTAIFPFFDHENNGNINIKGALKFFDKHTISLELASGLNILPSIYKQGDHIKNTKNFYTTYQNGLNKKYYSDEDTLQR